VRAKPKLQIANVLSRLVFDCFPSYAINRIQIASEKSNKFLMTLLCVRCTKKWLFLYRI